MIKTKMNNILEDNEDFYRVESLDINGVSTFTIRQPTFNDLDDMDSFIKYIDSVKYEYKEYRKSLINTFFDKIDIEDT